MLQRLAICLAVALLLVVGEQVTAGRGEASGGLARITPSVVDVFAHVGETSQFSVTVSNDLTFGPVIIEHLFLEGEGGSSFSISNDGCAGVTLQPRGAPCIATLEFSPEAEGLFTAFLDVSSDSQSSGASLRGHGYFDADMAVTVKPAKSHIRSGGEATFEAVVENLGPDQASNVKLMQFIPRGLDFVSVSTTQGECSFGYGYPWSEHPYVIICMLETIDRGDQVVVQADFEVSAPKNTSVNTIFRLSGWARDVWLSNNWVEIDLPVKGGPIKTP